MKIYVAGPYSQGDVAKNVHETIVLGDYLAMLGHTVFIPHLTHFWHLLIPHEYEFWLEQDLPWIEVCDALFRMPGESAGADREVEYAKMLGKKVLYDLKELR